MNSKFTIELKSVYHTNFENLWVQLNLAGSKSVLIGAYYKPHESDQASFEELIKSLTLVNQTNSTVWLLGDFNLPKIDWENLKPLPDCGHPTFYRECIEALNDCLLEQTVTSPTRGQIFWTYFSQQTLPSWKMYQSSLVSLTMILYKLKSMQSLKYQSRSLALLYYIRRPTGTSSNSP